LILKEKEKKKNKKWKKPLHNELHARVQIKREITTII
jgi:hypothetical protein